MAKSKPRFRAHGRGAKVEITEDAPEFTEMMQCLAHAGAIVFICHQSCVGQKPAESGSEANIWRATTTMLLVACREASESRESPPKVPRSTRKSYRGAPGDALQTLVRPGRRARVS